MNWELRNVGWPIPYNDYKPVFKKIEDHGWPIPYNEHLYTPYLPLTRFYSELYKGKTIDNWV